jgi:hypothetical protein
MPCKHLHRGLVIAKGTLVQAAIKLVKQGVFEKLEHFWIYFEKRVDQIGINPTICGAIRAGLGDDHPHVTDYKIIAKKAQAYAKAKAC